MEVWFLTIVSVLFIGCVDASMVSGTNQHKQGVVSRIAYMPTVETVSCAQYSNIEASRDCHGLKIILPTDRTIVGQTSDQNRFLNENAKLLLEPPVPLTTNGSGKSQVAIGVPSLHSEWYKVVIVLGNIAQVVQIKLNDNDRMLIVDVDNTCKQINISEKLQNNTVLKTDWRSLDPLYAAEHKITIGVSKRRYGVSIDDGEELALSSDRTVEKTGSLWFNVLPGNSYSLYRVEFQALHQTECSELKYPSGNGVYTIYSDGKHRSSVDVYCQLEDDEQMWTVIQRRFDGSVNFYRGWDDYKTGFGSADGEYWIGNDIIHELTSHESHELLVVMSDFAGNTKRARYSTFRIEDESRGYKLFVGGCTGGAGDSLAYHNGSSFTTFDEDLDQYNGRNCTTVQKGAWWYKDCHNSNLNGRYLKIHYEQPDDGVIWHTFHDNYQPLKTTTMMIRKV